MTTNVSTRAKQRLFSSLLFIFLFCAGCNRTAGDNPATPSVITFIGWGPATQRELAMDRSVFGQFSQETESTDLYPGPRINDRAP